MLAGILPLSELLWSQRSAIDVKFPSDSGMDPVNWLLKRYRVVSSVRLPSALGMVPLSALSSSALCRGTSQCRM